MKKVFKILLVIVTVFANLSLKNAYATNENLIIEKNMLKDGRIEVLVDVKEDAHICGGEFVFEYDKEKLELENVKTIEKQNILTTVNEDYQNEGNKIKAVFASAYEVKGYVFAITLKSKNKDAKDADIVLEDCLVGDETGKSVPSINKDTVTYKRETGKSKIDEAFKDAKQTNDNQEKTYSTKTVKENAKKESKKATQKSNTSNKKSNTMPYIIGFVALVLIILVIYKIKKK